MEEIIDKLIELEYRAQKITTDAKKKEKSISEQIEKRRKEIEGNILDTYQKKLDEMRTRENLDKQQRLDEIENKKLKQIETLENEFNQNHLKWEQDLFDSIIGTVIE